MESLLTFEAEGFSFKGHPFVPKIFDSLVLDEPIPSFFNAVKISLNGRMDADLDFRGVKAYAERVVEKGLLILWQIDLGLFLALLSGLSSEAQVRTLQRTLEAFIDEVYTPFFEKSLGVVIFQGTSEFAANFPWSNPSFAEDALEVFKVWLKEEFSTPEKFSEEFSVAIDRFDQVDRAFTLKSKAMTHVLNLFCRDLSVDYLNILTESISESIPFFVMIDCEETKEPGYLAEILDKDRFEKYFVVTKGGPLPVQGLCFDDERASFGFISRRELQVQKKELAKSAVCLPGEFYYRPKITEELNNTLLELNKRFIHYRVIPQAQLLSDWHGLDYIIVLTKTLEQEGRRVLKGFTAAGGEIVTVGGALKMEQQISFEKWKEELLEIL